MSYPGIIPPIFMAVSVLNVTVPNPSITNVWDIQITTNGQNFYGANLLTTYDIKETMWFSNRSQGFAWRIMSITISDPQNATIRVEDVDFYNNMLDNLGSGLAPSYANGFIFELDSDGLPSMYDIRSVTESDGITPIYLDQYWANDLIGRFNGYNNFNKYISQIQLSQTFVPGNVIYLDPTDQLFHLSTDLTGAIYNSIGIVTTSGQIDYNPDSFTWQPFGQYTQWYKIQPSIPALDPIGTVYYINATGTYSTSSTGAVYPVYIKIDALGNAILLSHPYGLQPSTASTGAAISGDGDTLYIDANLNVAGVLSVDKETGLVQIPNDLVVNGTIYANEIAYGDVVKIGDDITFTTSDGAVTANIGDFKQLKVHDEAKFYGDVIIKGLLEASTGVFNNLETQHLLVEQGASFSGPVTFGDTVTVNATLDASGQTGIFGTIIADNIIGPIPGFSGVVDNLTVTNNLYLGNEMLPIETGADDTVYINGNVNVSDLVNINRTFGVVEIANDLYVYGVLRADTFDFNNYLAVGDNIVLNSSSNNISVGSLSLTSVYFATGAALIYAANNASRGQVIVPNGYSSVLVLSSLVSPTSFVNAVVCSDNTTQVVQRVVPLPGAFKIVMSGTIGDIRVNWLIVN
jgi:hypothetical protein